MIIVEYRTLNGKAVKVPELDLREQKKVEVTMHIRLKVKVLLLVICKDA